MISRKIAFLTGTRADYGKIKSIIQKLSNSKKFRIYIFATGMHLEEKFGLTYKEIFKDFKNVKNITIARCSNKVRGLKREITLTKTIKIFSKFIDKINPHLIIVHGDRLEALAGSIVGTFKNYLVAHIEGGEISGTTDEHLRHAISKLSQIHFVANNSAKKLLIQMGENKKNIHVTGSPDLDLMKSKKLPTIEMVKSRYNINFDEYGVAILHPDPINLNDANKDSLVFVRALIESNKNFVIIFPNNDPGNEIILKSYSLLKKNQKVRIFRSMRFEYFITLIKYSSFMIGNSSAGIREAPFFGIPSINIGDRQNLRTKNKTIKNINFNKKKILREINNSKFKSKLSQEFGNGKSAQRIYNIINQKNFWKLNFQKYFVRDNDQ